MTSKIISISIILLVLSGCYSSSPPPPCPIDTLLIDGSILPPGIFSETGGRSSEDAPGRVGIEKIGTSFSSPRQGGLGQDVYRFWDVEEAGKEYKGFLSWFDPQRAETTAMTPNDLKDLPIHPDQYRIGCSKSVETGVEICRFVAQYDVYDTFLSAILVALNHNDFSKIIQNIDSRMVQCRKK